MCPKIYTIHDILAAGYNLEPLVCLHCGSTEVTYLQYLSDARCAECGTWQLDELEERNAAANSYQ